MLAAPPQTWQAPSPHSSIGDELNPNLVAMINLFSFSFSRVFKTPQELEVMRYVNRVSSEAHKEVIMFYSQCQTILKSACNIVILEVMQFTKKKQILNNRKQVTSLQ